MVNTNVQSIIEALECFQTNQHRCLKCDYNPHVGMPWPYGCIAGQQNIIEDTIALLKAQKADIEALSVKYSDLLDEKLKAQETRLLSIKELVAWEDNALWLELRAWPQPTLMPDAINEIVSPDEDSEHARAFFISGHIQVMKLYGTQWRCWTKRPTKAEMEAALWLPLI